MGAFPTNDKLTGVVQGFVPNKDFLAMSFFSRETCEGPTYSFDKITYNKGNAKFRNPDSAAGVVATTGKNRITARLHTLREKKKLPATLTKWTDGPGLKKPERFNSILAREMADLDDIFDRTWNTKAWALLNTGILAITGEDEASYDFGLTQSASAAVAWSSPATATPYADIMAGADTVRKNWGSEVVDIYMTSTALRYAMATAEVQALAGEVTLDEYLRTGVVKRIANMNVHLVDNGYTNDAGTWVPFLSDDGTELNMVILKAAGPVGLFVEGHPADDDAKDTQYGKFVKSWTQKDPSGRWVLETQTASLGLTMPNKLFVLTAW